MQLNTKLSVTECDYLLQTGKFDKLLQACTKEVTHYLQDEEYLKALNYYEYVLATIYNLGRFDYLSQHIIMYGKLCQLIGTKYHWTQYYRYLAFCQSFKKQYSLAIQSAKRSIYNAFQLQNYECISLGYGTLAMLYLQVDEQQQADFSLKLANYYSKKIHNDESTLRSHISLLYLYAITKDSDSFTQLREKLLDDISEDAYPFYFAKIQFFTGMIYFSVGKDEQALEQFKRGMMLLRKNGLNVYLHYLIDLFHRKDYAALFKDEQLAHFFDTLPLDVESIQQHLHFSHRYIFDQTDSLQKIDAFLKPKISLTPMLLLSDIVTDTLAKGEQLTMLSFSLNEQNSKSTLFKEVFILASDVLKDFDHFCTYKYNDDGIIVVKSILDVESILPKIYQAVRKLTEKNRIINPQLPIHFGVAYSTRLDQPTFEALYKKSSAALYYAKTTNKLYIM